MIFEIHPSAEDNFNRKARELISLVKIYPDSFNAREEFPSDIHFVVLEENIIRELEEEVVDFTEKRTIGRYFRHENNRYGICGDDYKKLIALAEQLQRIKLINQKLSLRYIELSIFKWIHQEYTVKAEALEFISYLEDKSEKDIANITSWIPIANLEVEVPFDISHSRVCPLSKIVVDQWESSLIRDNADDSGNLSSLFEFIRKEYQGLACVVTETNAEPQRAYEIAHEEAEQVTSILGIFSKAALIPRIKCVSKIKGSENISQLTCFQLGNEDSFLMRTDIIDKKSDFQWRLNIKKINELKSMLLDKINPIITSQNPTDFYRSIISSVYIYAKAAFTAEPLEKVIYILSALESILLKNESEPIQQNLAERVAFLIAKKIEERKKLSEI